MSVVSVLMVAWGTLDKAPWQLDALLFLALGWMLIPARLRHRLNKHAGSGGATTVVNLAQSVKENVAR